MHTSKTLRALFAIVSFAGLVGLIACGGGAAVGESCDTEGNADECESGAVCAKNESDVLQCLKVCASQTDCAAEEECNGITGSSLKACRSKDTTGGSGGKKN